MKYAIFLFIIFTLTGCANPGIVQLSPDTYMLSREDHGGIFGSMSSLKSGVISDANKFAEKQGKIAIPLNSHEKPVGYRPADWASFDYQFRVVNKNDREAIRTSLIPRADFVIQKTENITIDNLTKNDIYSDLIKLDDLYRRNIITQLEFDKLKLQLFTKQ